MLDEVGGTDEVADSPAGAVEVLARGADGEGAGGEGGREGCDAGERGIGKAVVDFVGKDQDVVFDAEGADGLEFGEGEDLADGVVAGISCQLVGYEGEERQMYGVLITIIFVLGLMAFSREDMSIVQSAAEDMSVAPFLGG